MKTMTFLKTVSKEQNLNPQFINDTKTFYDEIILSIDEIELWRFIGIERESFGDFIELKIKYNVTERGK